ncbi:hypothetical protein BDW62DRAFT_176870 [Aspergillus aurantiobrunneus]
MSSRFIRSCMMRVNKPVACVIQLHPSREALMDFLLSCLVSFIAFTAVFPCAAI